MTLTDDQIAAAKAAGCSFQPVPPTQLARFAMQRKVFHIAGAPVLATRGGGLFETAATLEGLLVLGRARIGAGPAQAALPAPMPQAAPAPPRPSRRAARPAAPAAGAPMAEGPVVPAPRSAAPPPGEPGPGPAAAAGTQRDRGSREPRWMTAGAERRGRAAVHWSTRLR